MTRKPVLPTTPPRFASLNAAGDYTQTSRDTVRRMIARGEIKSYRIGRQVRVDLNELDIAMARNAGWVA